MTDYTPSPESAQIAAVLRVLVDEGINDGWDDDYAARVAALLVDAARASELQPGLVDDLVDRIRALPREAVDLETGRLVVHPSGALVRLEAVLDLFVEKVS